MRTAANAATAEINPSSTTGSPYTIPPMQVPAIAAISSPPTLHNTSNASCGSGSYFKIASSITCFLCSRPLPVNPAPRPVILATGCFNSTLATALEVVVFPIPISPIARIFTPSCAFLPVSIMPVLIACMHCSGVIAGFFAKF